MSHPSVRGASSPVRRSICRDPATSTPQNSTHSYVHSRARSSRFAPHERAFGKNDAMAVRARIGFGLGVGLYSVSDTVVCAAAAVTGGDGALRAVRTDHRQFMDDPSAYAV